MAQYDLTDLVTRITAAGGDPADLLGVAERIVKHGGTYYAHNRQSQYAAQNFTADLERAVAARAAEQAKLADRKAAATEMLAKVRAGLTLFTKTPGHGWTIVGPTSSLTSGAQLDVTKTDGTTKPVFVRSVIASFSRDGVDYSTATFTSLPRLTAGRPRTARTRGRCDGCGNYSSQLTLVDDSSGVQGSCCPRCARLDPLELSFG
ncbi:hypothetical protein [Saccharothrix sp. HUAS TT1]|uniref:hypothetical protein n=1 Tax=unclassified Saccharothrix TaxID=2593673 RepID=UPI00345BC854